MNTKTFINNRIQKFTNGSTASFGHVQETCFGPCLIIHIDLVALYEDRIEIIEAGYLFFEGELAVEEVEQKVIGIE